MGVLVSRSGSRLQCDHIGCKNHSRRVQGENDGQRVVHEMMRNEGWQCCHNGKDYCPDHAYGKHLQASASY